MGNADSRLFSIRDFGTRAGLPGAVEVGDTGLRHRASAVCPISRLALCRLQLIG